MENSNLDEAIYSYQTALAQLSEESNQRQILKILYARDRLAHFLQTEPPISVSHQEQLAQLDQQLKEKADLMVVHSNLEPIRDSLNPAPEAWWWFPEKFIQPHKLDKHDWAWRSVTVVGWTVNLALLTDITSRFISGGLGLGGAGAIIFPSLLTLIKARGDLTEVGQASLRNLFKKIGVKSHWREEVTTISTLALLLVILGFWASLPQISKLYNYLGYRAAKAGDFPTAENNYQRAIALKEDNMSAHYNLGNLYEDLREIDQAKAEYEIVANAEPTASQNNVAFAQNNLARLLILEKDYSNAVMLLAKGQENLEFTTADAKGKADLQYNLFKNLGWARYKQELYSQANSYLTIASTMNSDKAPAYCLQAQNFQAWEKETEAIAAWQKCCNLANPIEPDQDQWLVMAHKALTAENQACEE